ncbi:MAG: SDR family NAD(P)-dependent oxidoreductase, partial [Ignavibacteriales bacterium]|nr:SDR family NAD(P)-dependent oxidoreductase [Ignavibacteriales bacterium]
MISLNNKVALITGGSRGIGAAAALMLAEAGATVAFTYASKKKPAQAVADKAARLSGSCLIIQADMGKPDDVKK